MIREKSSPSAPEHNMTTQFTQGKGDASSPEVSWDGKKIVFSMRCPAEQHVADRRPAGLHRPLEHLGIRHDHRRPDRRHLPPRHSRTGDDDVDPVYLPAGHGFVFTSNRQTESNVNQALGHSYYALDEYERERVFNLHTMAPTAATSRRSRSTRATTATR